MSLKTKWLVLIGIIILGAGFFVARAQPAAGIPDSPDAQKIMTVMDRAYVVMGTADVSAFPSVFVDTADYQMSAEEAKALTGIKNPGYLTAMQAHYIQTAQGEKLLQTALDKAKAENRELSAAEFQAVVQANHGEAPGTRYKTDEKRVLVYEQMTITGDRATVRYDDGAAQQDAILVRINGQWLIASIKPIWIHF